MRLLGEAWNSFLSAPLLGPGADRFFVQFGLAPHFPPLAYAISGGIVAGTLVAFLTVRLIRLLFTGWGRSASGLTRVGCLVAAILVGEALLEPDGPFLGMEMLALLFSVVIALSAPPPLDCGVMMGWHTEPRDSTTPGRSPAVPEGRPHRDRRVSGEPGRSLRPGSDIATPALPVHGARRNVPPLHAAAPARGCPGRCLPHVRHARR